MKRLIYVSAVPWSSFAQRPHKFVEWFHARTKGPVMWIDPYPTRFPRFADIKRLRARSVGPAQIIPSWMKVIQPTALPVEPIPGSAFLNSMFWTSLVNKAVDFAEKDETLLMVGKPSLLALQLLSRVPVAESAYDAMDDFPQFFDGLSRMAVMRREKMIVQKVNHIWASSTCLLHRWTGVRADVRLVRNGLDPLVLPVPSIKSVRGQAYVFGYVGTIAKWFDWEWILSLAQVRPRDQIRLIGPVFQPAPGEIPPNITMLPECSHADALNAMNSFDVGLIPFQRSALTDSVDPIKFYEYRALGLPVISTSFGEMQHRVDARGTFLSFDASDIATKAAEALVFREESRDITDFAQLNSWRSRFDCGQLF